MTTLIILALCLWVLILQIKNRRLRAQKRLAEQEAGEWTKLCLVDLEEIKALVAD